MTPTEFASRLLLRPFNSEWEPDYGRFGPHERAKQAAVLVPIIPRTNGLHILLTKRSRHLRSHPGQISFPGGKVDKTDDSLQAAAFREANEEVGVNTNNIKPLGWLPELNTISHFTMHPLVGFVHPSQEFRANDGEVDEIFEVPLDYLLQKKHQFFLSPKWQGRPSKVHFIRYQDKMIWGATAAILQKLIRHIE